MLSILCAVATAQTSLRDGVMSGNADVTLSILAEDHLIDIEQPSANGFTLLHVAAGSGHADIVKLLLAHGASSSRRSHAGLTPLHLAAGKGRADVVDVLVGAHADLNMLELKTGRSAAQIAEAAGHEEIARTLHAAVKDQQMRYYRAGLTLLILVLLLLELFIFARPRCVKRTPHVIWGTLTHHASSHARSRRTRRLARPAAAPVTEALRPAMAMMVATAKREEATRTMAPGVEVDGVAERGRLATEAATEATALAAEAVAVAVQAVQAVAATDKTDDDENTLCVICMAEPKSHALVPCGHRCVCADCAELVLADDERVDKDDVGRLYLQPGPACPLCRCHVDAVLRVWT